MLDSIQYSILFVQVLGFVYGKHINFHQYFTTLKRITDDEVEQVHEEN